MKIKQKHFLNVSRFTSLVLCLISCVLILTSCDTNEPRSETLSLTFEDASCTEVWLKLNGSAEGDYILKRDGARVEQISLSGTDNFIYDDSLQPNTTYTYQVTSIQKPASSNQISAVTMDTTSHDFTWETFTFGGQGGSSTLYDVAIIDENNIWAVGEIYTADDKYNAVHWDGSEWELLKVNYGGHFWPIRSVFAFSENEVWFSAYVIYDGERFIDLPIPEEITGWGINKTWGVSSSDFYVVGNGGNIAHYDGSNWGKIESGTDLDLKDIWGSLDGNTVWVCGNDDFKPTVLLKMENQQANLIYSSRDNLFSYDFNALSGNFRSVWTNSDNLVYILTSYDLYRVKNEDLTKPKALWRDTENQIATLRARGEGANDIFTAGFEGLLCHYNGVGWRTYTKLYSRFKTYRGLSVKDNIVVAVGQDYINGIEDKAIITLTKR